jgi:hypothetical protein
MMEIIHKNNGNIVKKETHENLILIELDPEKEETRSSFILHFSVGLSRKRDYLELSGEFLTERLPLSSIILE